MVLHKTSRTFHGDGDGAVGNACMSNQSQIEIRGMNKT